MAGTVAAAPAAVATTSPTVVINEVNQNGDVNDWVELLNTGDATADLSGWKLSDNKPDENFVILPPGTTLEPGAMLVLEDSVDFDFGLGKADQASLFDAGGGLVDEHAWTEHTSTSYGRCPDGTGDLIVTTSLTKGAANDCSLPVRINEVESDGDGADWVELVNVSDGDIDLEGLVLKDDDDAHAWTMPAGLTLPAGGFLAIERTDDAATGFDFGLGGADAARLFAADGVTLLDAHAWTEHAAVTDGRCPDGTGDFTDNAVATPGAANDCTVADFAVVFNEVESNGDVTDWAELKNLGATAVDLSGYLFRDDDDTREFVLPEGSVIAAGGYLVIDQPLGGEPGFGFGLGGTDTVRLFTPDDKLVADHAWDGHATVTYARCADGTGEWIDTVAATKGATNACGLPLRVNEATSQGEPEDWIEIVNISTEPVDASGVVVKDDGDDDAFTIPEGTVIGPDDYFVLTKDVDFAFGLGKNDQVRLFDPEGELLDSVTWVEHSTPSWGRCPEGTGTFEVNLSATPGSVNDCAGIVNASAWPGGADVATIDDAAWFDQDISSVDWHDGTLWAVENGNGLLVRLVEGASGWEHTVWTLRYPDGMGTVDAEGVHATDDAIYVASERNNDEGVSRPAVLRYEVEEAAELVATDEWNLAADFPGLGANQGLEGVTFVPDAWLVEQGLVDEATGVAYDPGSYAGHGDGLYVVGVEGTASAYAYALMDGGAFQRVSTIATDAVAFPLVADVQFDADRDLLWVVCDDACDGRIAAYTVVDGTFQAADLYERPAGMGNLGNEGFAVSDVCVDGAVATFYADDNGTDGHSLRTGTLPCADEAPAFIDVTGSEEHHAAILWMAERGISAGWTTPSGQEFRPFATATRDAIAAFLFRAAGSPTFDAPAEPTFSDVTPETSEFYAEIEWAVAEGIAGGWEDGTFRPHQPVTRDAIAAFLYRAAGSPEGVDLGALAAFDDVDGSEHATAIAWLAQHGIATGWKDGTYRPFEPVTRDAIAAFLMRWDAATA